MSADGSRCTAPNLTEDLPFPHYIEVDPEAETDPAPSLGDPVTSLDCPVDFVSNTDCFLNSIDSSSVHISPICVSSVRHQNQIKTAQKPFFLHDLLYSSYLDDKKIGSHAPLPRTGATEKAASPHFVAAEYETSCDALQLAAPRAPATRSSLGSLTDHLSPTSVCLAGIQSGRGQAMAEAPVGKPKTTKMRISGPWSRLWESPGPGSRTRPRV